MIELALLVLAQRLINCGYRPLIATRSVAADLCVLNGFLSNPENQWRLAGSFADAVALSPAATSCDAELNSALARLAAIAAYVAEDPVDDTQRPQAGIPVPAAVVRAEPSAADPSMACAR